jgi:hypothetical protein
MAFSSAVLMSTQLSRRKRLMTGTFTQAVGDAGGEIDTGLKAVDTFVWSCSSHLDTGAFKVTKNSATTGKVTIVTATGMTTAVAGDWMAVGT